MTLFGLQLPLEEYPVDIALTTARFLEDLGFDAIFVNDHYMKPNGNNISDAYLTLSAIAAQTKKIRIGTAVTPITFRPVHLLAKMVATLDNISKGRFLFGVGAGNVRTEFEAFGMEFLPPADRVAKSVEGLKLMKQMWTGEEVTVKGVYYNVKGAVILPKPVQKPHPPILIGSEGKVMCKVTARLADGWIPSYLKLEDYRQLMKEIIEEARNQGRKRNDFTFVHYTKYVPATNKKEGLKSLYTSRYAHLSPPETIEAFVTGSPEECAQQLQGFIDLGVEMILLGPSSAQNIQEQIISIHDEIIPRLTNRGSTL